MDKIGIKDLAHLHVNANRHENSSIHLNNSIIKNVLIYYKQIIGKSVKKILIEYKCKVIIIIC